MFRAILIDLLLLAVGRTAPAFAQSVSFGDDASQWARDGECDDDRFEGQGMSSIVLISDVGCDAADCKAFCRQGVIALRNN